MSDFYPHKIPKTLFFQNKSYGVAGVVSPHVNARIGRNWEKKELRSMEKRRDEELLVAAPTSGQLFGRVANDDDENESEVVS